jgi:hypothetical protein
MKAHDGATGPRMTGLLGLGPRMKENLNFCFMFSNSGCTRWAGPTVLLAALRARPSGRNDKMHKVVLNYVLSFFRSIFE